MLKRIVFFFNEWGNLTTKHSADYFAIWSDDDSSRVRTGYYLENMQLKFIEKYQSGIKTGKSIYYHKNGSTHYEAQFHNDHPTGVVIFFYPKGTLESERVYEKVEKANFIIETKYNFGIINYYDSSGNWLTKNGFGIAYEYEVGKKSKSKASGKIVAGVKNSVWTSYFENGKIHYTELWDRGTLIKGTSTWLDSSQYTYKAVQRMAESDRGMQAFYRYVGETMKYPKDARRNGIEGRVFVEFIVNRDGSISHVKVIRGIGGGCDEEAVRVIKSAPNWKSGLQRGRPVRSKFNLAIIFKLG